MTESFVGEISLASYPEIYQIRLLSQIFLQYILMNNDSYIKNTIIF